jgi:hypothetical protein
LDTLSTAVWREGAAEIEEQRTESYHPNPWPSSAMPEAGKPLSSGRGPPGLCNNNDFRCFKSPMLPF